MSSWLDESLSFRTLIEALLMITVDIQTIWSKVLDVIRLELNEPNFKTWFEHTVPIESHEEGVFLVGVQNDFARAWLEERYTQRLSAAVSQVVGEDLCVRIVVDGSAPIDRVYETDPEPAEVIPSGEEHSETVTFEDEYNPKFTFDSFVVGDSNAFARNAALAVAEQPGLKYNPLFLWGGPGLGKTHLLHAIAQYVNESFPHKKVLFVTAERFLNDFVDSVNSKTANEFRRKYRTVDVLLIDDIQFFQKKEGIQEQFFNTFNELMQRGKAVVLASDRPPREINMEERYTSRFASGLPADIQPPNYETRLAILRQYVEREKMPVEPEALSYVAEISTPNIREMEGAMNRIGAWLHLSKRPVVDIEMAREVLLTVFPDHSARPISLASIQREVCRFYGIAHTDLVGSKRSQNIVYPRQIAMYLARDLTDLSLPKIGDAFGGRDHTTVMHATAKIHKLMSEQRDVYNQIQTLTNQIRQKN
jgi:chromosomal replication initiator protein